MTVKEEPLDLAIEDQDSVEDQNFEAEILILRDRLNTVKMKTIHRPKVEYEMVRNSLGKTSIVSCRRVVQLGGLLQGYP